MDLAKDILDIAEKVGQAPGLTVASSIVTSILQTVETSKNNTLRLRNLAHSIASQLIDISENMKAKWDHAPLTLKRAVDEYEMFLLEMLKGITRLSQYSRLRAFLLAGEREREITRLEKRVADVRSTITLMIGMNLSVAMNQVQTSLASSIHIGQEVHSGVRCLVDGVRLLDVESDSHRMTPDFTLFTREDFQVMMTIFRETTYDRQCQDTMTTTIHRAERCSNGRVILVKTFEGGDLGRVRRRFTKELETNRRVLNAALLQVIGWSSATAQIPFHVYHSPGGIMEPFRSWAERTLHSNPVETIFGLYDMRNSIKELSEFERSASLFFFNLFHEAVVNIQQYGDRPRFSLVYTGTIFKRDLLDKEYPSLDCRNYMFLSHNPIQWQSECSIKDLRPAATLMTQFAGGAKSWFGDVHGIEALFKGSYDTINPLQLGPALMQAGWLGTSSMCLTFQGRMRLGDVGYVAPDGHFEVVTNLHARLVSRTGGPPGWIYERFQFHDETQPEDEYSYAIVSHSETLYRRYRHVFPPQYTFSRTFHHRHHCVEYTDLDEGRAWEILQQEVFCFIEDSCIPIAPHELQLLISITDFSTFQIGRRHHWIEEVEPTEQEECPPDPATITLYEFQREGILTVSDSGVPELNPGVLYSFQEHMDGLDPTKIQRHPETGDILMRQDSEWPRKIEYLQLPLGISRPSGIE